MSFMKIKFIILALFILLMGCKKFTYTGELEMEFEQSPEEVCIYPIENTARAIMEVDFNGSTIKKVELNPGNYYCVPMDQEITYVGASIQVQADNTTTLKFSRNGQTVISY